MSKASTRLEFTAGSVLSAFGRPNGVPSLSTTPQCREIICILDNTFIHSKHVSVIINTGIKKHARQSAALKDSNKRSSLRHRPDLRPQGNEYRGRAPRIMPLLKLFDPRGMRYGRRRILRTVRDDYQLRREFRKLGIKNKKSVEEALLELLFQYRNLKDWESGGDNLVDVFRLIKGRVAWASNCSVDLIMQLFFALIRARLRCPARLRSKSGRISQRVDQVIRYINGVDHLLAEYEIYEDLVLPIHHAVHAARNLPKVAKTPSSAMPGAVFLQGISRLHK